MFFYDKISDKEAVKLMLRILCKSKIQKPVVTQCDLNYEGSITIDEEMMEAADILPYERVQVINLSNGARLETYVISGQKGSGIIGMNGGMARHAAVGDKLLIISYTMAETVEARSLVPHIITVNQQNRIITKE